LVDLRPPVRCLRLGWSPWLDGLVLMRVLPLRFSV
jgi:hypothetical protein